MYTIGFITQGRINQSLSSHEEYKYYDIIYTGMYVGPDVVASLAGHSYHVLLLLLPTCAY